MITDFDIEDLGVENVNTCLAFDPASSGYEYAFYGIGTDAESALDDLLYALSERFDITGVEGRIKDVWNPTEDEGDGEDRYYHLGLMFNYETSPLSKQL